MFLAVFVGGALGSLLREALSLEIPGVAFLTSTFGINVAACFVLGWLYSVRHKVHAHVLHLGAVGFCGGLSTFSSFVADLERFAESDLWIIPLAVGLEITFGLGAALVGEKVGHFFHSERSSS
ncbi:CrcB family protein [uncultured Ruegeria sp.]|uniref:fluoride efflux transporter FluC n=1 Tax=uncultured Ruegeria sp. TaxID=259304 RepID=UPI002602E80A|nr:CrcB family protein [uncultured Ruegeria sp.]